MARIAGSTAAMASAAANASSRGETCVVATRLARPSASKAAYSEGFIADDFYHKEATFAEGYGGRCARGALAKAGGPCLRGVVDEVHDLVFGPVAIVTRAGRADEAAVAAVAAYTQIDVRVAGDLRIAKGLRRDERVVFGGDDESGDADAMDDAHGAGAMIVVFFVAESEVRRRVRAIERAHGFDPVQVREVERAG